MAANLSVAHRARPPKRGARAAEVVVGYFGVVVGIFWVLWGAGCAAANLLVAHRARPHRRGAQAAEEVVVDVWVVVLLYVYCGAPVARRRVCWVVGCGRWGIQSYAAQVWREESGGPCWVFEGVCVVLLLVVRGSPVA